MKVLMFQDRFAGKVRDGSKPHTIRKTARCKPGDVLSLRQWTGKPYRSKQEVLREEVCQTVTPCEINWDGMKVGNTILLYPNKLAMADGFTGWPDMRDWFEHTHGLPFHGAMIFWKVNT
jgi:hypothetical protein